MSWLPVAGDCLRAESSCQLRKPVLESIRRPTIGALAGNRIPKLVIKSHLKYQLGLGVDNHAAHGTASPSSLTSTVLPSAEALRSHPSDPRTGLPRACFTYMLECSESSPTGLKRLRTIWSKSIDAPSFMRASSLFGESPCLLNPEGGESTQMRCEHPSLTASNWTVLS